MENKSRGSPINEQICEEACEWFLEFRLEEPDIATRKAFDRWMRRSPEHVAAYLKVAALWSDPAAYDDRRKWDSEALIRQAREIPHNVLPLAAKLTIGEERSAEALEEGTEPRALLATSAVDTLQAGQEELAIREHVISPAPSARGRLQRASKLSLAASIMIAFLGLTLWHQIQGDTYRTEVGEHRSIRLEDGSTVELNSKTTIRVRYRKHERNIDIKQGQALFKVVADSTRPFVVESNGTHVRAVGTQFDVYRKIFGTVVTVVEGSVMVSPPAAPASRSVEGDHGRPGSPAAIGDAGETSDHGVLLEADQQVTVAPNVPLHVEEGAASAAIAWTRRKIVFSRAALAEVAEEFNRYSTRRLVVENPGEYDFHVSGVFSSSDIDSIINFLRTRPGIEIKEDAAEIRIRKKIDITGYLQSTNNAL